MAITYNVRQMRGITVVDLGGKIILGEAVASGSEIGVTLHEFVHDLLKAGHNDILLNLHDVSYVDSSGIGDLFSCHTTVRRQGGVLKLTNPNERVGNLLRLTKLDTLIEVSEDEVTAIRAWPKAGAA